MELKDIFDYVGVDAENIEDFKKAFDGKFITRENALSDSEIKSKITGAMAGGITTYLRRDAKEKFGLEVSKDEIEGKKIEDILDMVTTAAKSGYDNQISKLNEQIKSSPKVDEVVKDWEAKYEKVLGEKTNYETLLNDTKKEFEDFRVNVETEKKTGSINSKVDSMVNGLKWSEHTNDFTKSGFLASMQKDYTLDLNENGELQIKKDGNLIPNPTKHGEFLSPMDVYKSEAEKNKLLEVPNAKKGTFVNTQVVNPDGIPNPNKANRAANHQSAI